MNSGAATIAMRLYDRLVQITVANGFETDIGSTVFRGKLTLQPDQMPCCVMVEGEDQPLQQKFADVQLKQRYVFEGHMRLAEPDDIKHPNDIAHKIIRDLKRAIFSVDLTLGGLVKKEPTAVAYVGRRINPREDGQALIAASIEIDVTYVENLGEP